MTPTKEKKRVYKKRAPVVKVDTRLYDIYADMKDGLGCRKLAGRYLGITSEKATAAIDALLLGGSRATASRAYALLRKGK